jgi:hypothetical protein
MMSSTWSGADRKEGYEWLATHNEDWHRALDVQGVLWRSGHVRAVGFPDLLVAAVAEREHVMLLHYDGDHDLIAEVTMQPMQWVVGGIVTQPFQVHERIDSEADGGSYGLTGAPRR